MTKERFDQFKNNMLELSQEAGVLWDEFYELKATNNMVVRLARKQKRQIDLLEQNRQKTNDEIKLIMLELRKAHEKIKDLEKEKLKSNDLDVIEPVANENNIPVQDTIDLEMLVNDIDTKLAIKEEEQTFNYLKKMDMDL